MQNGFTLPEAALRTLPSTREEDNNIQPLVSSKSENQSSRRPSAQLHVPLLDLSRMPNGNAMKEVHNQQAPLLSPVLETRTPSPTANRRAEKSKAQPSDNPNLSAPINGSALKQAVNPPSQIPSSGYPVNGSASAEQRNGIGHGRAAQGESSSKPDDKQWQQPSKKGNRKKKQKSASVSNISEGQPLPANPAERKGG